MKSADTNSSVSTPDSATSGRIQRLLKYLPLAILVLFLLLTLILWNMYEYSLNKRAQDIFVEKTATISNRIVDRLHDHEQVLRGAAGLFSANEATSRVNWRQYVAALQLTENHPGILGVGFSKWLTPEDKEAHIKKIRAEGFPEYSIRPPGERPEYTSIIYLEPFNAVNLRAFGYDMYSEPVRRAAMDKARDGNITAIGAKIILVQETDKNKQSGMLMYVPVYRQGVPLDSVGQRRAAFLGFAYSPIRMNDFVYGTFTKLPDDIAFDIAIVGGTSADNLMFSSIQAEKMAVPEDYKPAITKATTVQAYGCSWQFTFKTLPGFNKEFNSKQSYLFLCIGILFSTLCSYMTLLMLKLKNQAIRRADEKIGELGKRLSLAAAAAQIGVWEYLLPENRFIWDEWMFALYGIREEDFVGTYQAWQNALHPDDKEPGDVAINQALRGEKDFDIEFRVVWPTGDIRHIKANALVLRDAAGNPLRMIGTNYDITERKLAEEALRWNSSLLEMMTNSSPLAFFVVDNRTDKILYYNHRFCEIWGITHLEEQMSRGELTNNQIVPDCLPVLVDVPAFAESCKPLQDEENRITIEDFIPLVNDRTMRRYSKQIRGSDDEYFGRFYIFEDVTSQKHAEEILRDTMNKAEAANKAKSQFLANMSHEIRTPMNAVMGMLHLLQRTELSPRQLDYAIKIQTASQTLLSILNDILDFSKIEAGRLELENSSFSLNELLRNLSVILSSAVQNKDLEILFSIAPNIPNTLRGDGLRLQQVLLNLASNAIKFTEQGEVIISVQALSLTSVRAELEFSVRDTGIGIAPDMQGLIFSGFVQAEASTTRRFGGTGLGLSISSQLVSLMGGELNVESESGRGSNFHFRVTLERSLDAPVIEKRRSERVVSGSPDHPVHTLIVDDNAIAREVLSSMVSSFGWQAETASSGPEAIALIEAMTNGHFPFDVIFMDWKMPGMDGIEAAKQIRGLRHGDKAPLVIMVTAHGREFLTENHQEESSPLDGFLVKPVTPSMLFDAVADVTSGRSRMVNRAKRSFKNQQRLLGLRLLVAEDNLINQQVAEEMLTQEGATVALAANGCQAIELILREKQFDALLMDIQMPEMDGYEATLHIRNVLGLKDLPIIAMTANALPADRERCLEVGMNDHVGKPFDVDKLIVVLRRNCGMAAEPEPVGHSTKSAVSLDRHGFDCDAALTRLGNNRSLYARMARAFEKDQGVVMERLRQELSALDLHTIKGVAATLGAPQLSHAAAETETALKNNGTPETIKPLLQKVERLFEEACIVFKDLAEELDPLSSEEHVVAVMDSETVIATLVELEALLKVGNMRAMQDYQEARAGLKATVDVGAKVFLPLLDEAMERLDFAGAGELCKKVREAMASGA